jgi:hypothetical protein
MPLTPEQRRRNEASIRAAMDRLRRADTGKVPAWNQFRAVRYETPDHAPTRTTS